MILGLRLCLPKQGVLVKSLAEEQKPLSNKVNKAAAKAIGSDYIVVGRPITAAADPVAAYERCLAEFVD